MKKQIFMIGLALLLLLILCACGSVTSGTSAETMLPSETIPTTTLPETVYRNNAEPQGDVLTVSLLARPFTLTNAEGKTLRYEKGDLIGSMSIHDQDYFTGSPAEMQLDLEWSNSITFVDTAAEDFSFSVRDEVDYYSIRGKGLQSVMVNMQNRRVHLEASEAEYRVWMPFRNHLYGNIVLEGYTQGNVTVSASDTEICVEGPVGEQTLTLMEKNLIDEQTLRLEFTGKNIIDFSAFADMGEIYFLDAESGEKLQTLTLSEILSEPFIEPLNVAFDADEVLMLTLSDTPFEIANAAGKTLRYVDGQFYGTMTLYQDANVTNGIVTLIVERSDVIYLSKDSDDYAELDVRTEDGWATVSGTGINSATVDLAKQAVVTHAPGDHRYRVWLQTNIPGYDYFFVSGKSESGVSVDVEGTSIILLDLYGDHECGFANAETLQQKTITRPMCGNNTFDLSRADEGKIIFYQFGEQLALTDADFTSNKG